MYLLTEKELKKLNRQELLEVLLAQSKKIDRLQAQLKETKEKLAEKELMISEAGSIAEASLVLNNIFADAQKAADQYLENIRLMQSSTRTIFNTHPDYEGFTLDHTEGRGYTRRFYYRRNKYNLSYDANGGTPYPDERVYFGKALTEYNHIPSKAGEEFEGWFYDAGFNNPVGWDTRLRNSQHGEEQSDENSIE